MSLFGGSIPKGITEKELGYIRGELLHAPYGHAGEKFTDMEVNRVIEMLRMAMDADTYAERQHNAAQVNENEAKMVENQMAHTHGINFSTEKQARLHTVLKKYLDQNIVHGLFS